MNKVLFPYISWWLLLLIPFTFLGFYPSYFSRLLEPMNHIYHIHALFMVLWVMMAMVQPFLIHYKKIGTHRLIGKISYVVMPLVFVTGYWVIRHTYYNFIDEEMEDVAKGISMLSMDEIKSNSAYNILLGSVYYVWLVVFYMMAVINKKNILFHATYMFSAILTILGPTVERLIYNVFAHLSLPYTFIVQNSVFIFIILIVLGLTLYQWRKNTPIKPSVVALVLYVTGMVGYFFLPDTWLWNRFVELVL